MADSTVPGGLDTRGFDDEAVPHLRVAGANVHLYRPRIGHVLEAGPQVVYAMYDRFLFAVNTGREASSICVSDKAEVVFPACGMEARSVQNGSIELPPLQAAFCFSKDKQ